MPARSAPGASGRSLIVAALLSALGALLRLRLDQADLLADDRGHLAPAGPAGDRGFPQRSLWQHVGISVYRVLSGVFYGALVGIPLGFAMGSLRCARLFDPIVEFMRPIPPLALIPLVILWFGIDETAKIFLLFLPRSSS